MLNKIYEKIKNFIKVNIRFLLIYLFILILILWDMPYVIYKRGGVIDVSNRIQIESNNEVEGKIQLSYVSTLKGNIPFILLSYILPDWDLYKIEEVSASGNIDEDIKKGKIKMNEGIDNAIISAFRESGNDIKINKTYYNVEYFSSYADTDLKIGDQILSFDGIEYSNVNELKEYINTLNIGDKVILKLINNEEKYATVYEYNNELYMGVSFSNSYDYETPIKVDIKTKNNESGSSGGFMTSLAIYNALTNEDITRGYNIVGTGTIDSLGNVGEIGGVKYKLLGAVKNKADIFMCPENNYEEAMEVKNNRKLNIEVVSVKTLRDAITYLENK